MHTATLPMYSLTVRTIDFFCVQVVYVIVKIVTPCMHALTAS